MHPPWLPVSLPVALPCCSLTLRARPLLLRQSPAPPQTTGYCRPPGAAPDSPAPAKSRAGPQPAGCLPQRPQWRLGAGVRGCGCEAGGRQRSTVRRRTEQPWNTPPQDPDRGTCALAKPAGFSSSGLRGGQCNTAASQQPSRRAPQAVPRPPGSNFKHLTLIVTCPPRHSAR